MSRKIIIGVMGGNRSVGALAGDACEIGAAIARTGNILLTGGCCIESNEIKHAAMQGAKNESIKHAENVARLIGILAKGRREWNARIPHTLFLRTNLGSVERDPITGVTPDVSIFFAGSCGTLCELAFALQANRRVLLWNAVANLWEKYQQHTNVDAELNDVLKGALRACKTKLISVPGITADTTVAMLKANLEHHLTTVHNVEGSTDQLIYNALTLTNAPLSETGFPGFQDDPQSKRLFEEIVVRISG